MRVFDLIEKEKQRQINGLEMIPSENFASSDVLKALGSILTNKYSEGYPNARYYSGNRFIDEIESYAKGLANKLFGTVHANVQAYSGSPANLAVLLALAEIGDTILGLSLASGGHLTHGAGASFTSKLFKSVQYSVGSEGKIDMKEVERLAKKHKPKIIWVGGTAYPYIFDWAAFSKIADKGAYLVADISHIAGLVVAGAHPSPVKYADVLTTTTHKTLRGPRGAMILVTEKGIKKDRDLPSKIDKAVFPGLQGGPHDNQVAALVVCLEEALKPNFKKYQLQVIKNAKVLAIELGCQTENHLILWDLSTYGFGLGYQMHIALEEAGIYVNKNLVPSQYDESVLLSPRTLPFTNVKGKNTPVSAYYPNGIRLGTPALTSRGMKEAEMRKIVGWVKRVLAEVVGYDLPKEQTKRSEFIKDFRKKIKNNIHIKQIKKEVETFAKKYPVPGISDE